MSCRWADIISSDSGYSFGRIARLENGTKKKFTDDSTFDPSAYEITEIRSINGHVSKLNIKKSPIRCSFKGILTELSNSDSSEINNKSVSVSNTPHTNLIPVKGDANNKKLTKKDHNPDQSSDVYYSHSTNEPLNPTKKRKDTTHSNNEVNKTKFVPKNITVETNTTVVPKGETTNAPNNTFAPSKIEISTNKKWNIPTTSATHTSNWPSLSQGNNFINGFSKSSKNDKRRLEKSQTLPFESTQIDDIDMNQLMDLLSTGDLNKLASLPTESIEKLTKSLSSGDVNRLSDYQRNKLLEKTTLMQQTLMQQISDHKIPPNNVQVESNMERINARLKDIAVGKMTKEYKNYISKVPRHKRGDDDPQTPDPMEKCSSAKFRSKYRIWRVNLHKYDNK